MKKKLKFKALPVTYSREEVRYDYEEAKVASLMTVMNLNFLKENPSQGNPL